MLERVASLKVMNGRQQAQFGQPWNAVATFWGEWGVVALRMHSSSPIYKGNGKSNSVQAWISP
jgi:hypothetical protein